MISNSMPLSSTGTAERVEAAVARIGGSASLEVSVKSADVVAECARWLIPGTEVFISMVPGQTYDQTIALAHGLRQAGFNPVAHVTARNMIGQAMADDVFARLAQAGVNRVLALGGDRVPAPGAYDSALALLESGAPARAGIRHIYLAGYPEAHPVISQATLTEHLTHKLAWCAAHDIEAEVITQFSFDEMRICQWLDHMADNFADTRVVVGAAGPAGTGTLLRYAALCGVRASARMLMRHTGTLLQALKDAGPEALVRALAIREIDTGQTAELHLFSFGGTERTARWCHQASKTDRR